MKLKREFITHMDGDEQMMIDVSAQFNGMVRSNKTAAYIVDLLKEETTVDEIVTAMLQKYDVREDIVRHDVMEIIQKLTGIGALDE